MRYLSPEFYVPAYAGVAYVLMFVGFFWPKAMVALMIQLGLGAVYVLYEAFS